jgi:ribosomal protein L3 glutamine methyltransferase
VLTVSAAIDALVSRFSEARLVYGHGTDSAWDEAVALVLHVADLPDDRSALNARLTDSQVRDIDALATRRIEERIPLPYLTGVAAFAGHRFHIEPGVVIPRSPIGQLLLQRFSPWLRRVPATAVDVCCGSGCIGIALALEFPELRVDLTDVDPLALAVAERNVVLHNLCDRVRVVRSDLLNGLDTRRWDLVVSNPPYVDHTDLNSLPPEYGHEPSLGLDGGSQGLDVIARLLDSLPARLAPDGLFVCEVGASAPALIRRYPRLAFIWPDLPAGGEGVFMLTGESLRIRP